MLELTDTHCHIHEAQHAAKADDATQSLWRKAANPDPDAMIDRALQNGVTRLICVGTTLADSKQAVDFVQERPNCWASVGLHPHEAKDGRRALAGIAGLLDGGLNTSGSAVKKRQAPFASAPTRPDKIVAVGEIGLDYFYDHSNKADQQKALRFQIELALTHNLPIIFHVREAFNDFWPIFDSYRGIRGVLHSFTDSYDNFTEAMKRDLFIGMNGIMTFTKVDEQLRVAKEVPLQKLLLETDAPFLTPKPHRGTVNEPAHLRLVAEFLSDIKQISLQDLARQTTKNAFSLFTLS